MNLIQLTDICPVRPGRVLYAEARLVAVGHIAAKHADAEQVTEHVESCLHRGPPGTMATTAAV